MSERCAVYSILIKFEDSRRRRLRDLRRHHADAQTGRNALTKSGLGKYSRSSHTARAALVLCVAMAMCVATLQRLRRLAAL